MAVEGMQEWKYSNIIERNPNVNSKFISCVWGSLSRNTAQEFLSSFIQYKFYTDFFSYLKAQKIEHL